MAFDPNMAIGGGLLAMIMGFLAVFALIFVALYVYMALALMAVAKRLGTPNAWLAWIPVGNFVLMANMAKMPWWPVLLLIGLIIPILNIFVAIAFAVFVYLWIWKICEARNRPGWWSLLQLIPFAGAIWGLILWGILAWSKE